MHCVLGIQTRHKAHTRVQHNCHIGHHCHHYKSHNSVIITRVICGPALGSLHKSRPSACVCVCLCTCRPACCHEVCAYVGVWQRDAHSYSQMSPWSDFSIFYIHLCLPFKPFVFFSSPSFLFCYWFPSFPCVWLISPMSVFNFPSVPFRPMLSPPSCFESLKLSCHAIISFSIIIPRASICACVFACGHAPYLFLSLSRRRAVCRTMTSNQGSQPIFVLSEFVSPANNN